MAASIPRLTLPPSFADKQPCHPTAPPICPCGDRYSPASAEATHPKCSRESRIFRSTSAPCKQSSLGKVSRTGNPGCPMSRVLCETWGLCVLLRANSPDHYHPPIVLLASDFSTLVLTPLIDL